MRLDEDVGKVSQATPILIAKALESFLEALLAKTVEETKAKETKKVTPAHLKKAIENEPKFDFLLDLVKNLPEIEVEEKPKRKRKSKKDEVKEEPAAE